VGCADEGLSAYLGGRLSTSGVVPVEQDFSESRSVGHEFRDQVSPIEQTAGVDRCRKNSGRGEAQLFDSGTVLQLDEAAGLARPKEAIA
jgi:hypothetical protein